MILLTADWHIKIGAKNIPREWANNRYNLFLDQVKEIESKCSLHIVAGDLFDRTPTLEELQVFFNFIKNCTIKTLIISGNHEATKKNNSFFPQLQEVCKALNPLVDIITTTTEYDAFTLLPYEDLHQANSIEKCNKTKALFTHVRGEIPPHVKPEVNLDRFNDFPVVYAGDLHSHSNTQRNIVYPGSPMTTSFHRNLVDTGYILIDENDLTKWSWHKFNLPQILRKTITDPNDMVATDYHHTIYEIEGDLQQLSTVVNTELLDKKIVKRSSEVTINLLEKTLEEELAIYLTEVLELGSESVEAALEVFNSYSTRT